jgi:hypothetical protein
VKHYPPKRTGPHTGWSPSRDRKQQQAFRNALLQRSGQRCEYINSFGTRCNERHGLQAHHDQPGYTPDCGRLLCREHHKAEDPHAR